MISSKTRLQFNQFWKFVTPDKYPKLHNFGSNVIWMFGSTYICECAFSRMKMFKLNDKNKLSQDYLKSIRRILTIETEVDVPAQSTPISSVLTKLKVKNMTIPKYLYNKYISLF